jgi:excisionase family DNA binding protein
MENLSEEPNGRLLTITELSAYLRVSTQTIFRLIRKGELPCVKVADRTLFRPADIERFLDAHTHQADRSTT